MTISPNSSVEPTRRPPRVTDPSSAPWRTARDGARRRGYLDDPAYYGR